MKKQTLINGKKAILSLSFLMFISVLTFSQNDLAKYIPAQGPSGTNASFTMPSDVYNQNDIKEALAADYNNNEGQNIANIYCISTTNTAFNHTKVLSERFSGINLDNIKYTNINGKSFILSVLTSKNGETEYNINFSAHKNGNTYYINNEWKETSKNLNETILNFQIWSASEETTKALAESVLSNLMNESSVEYNSNGAVYPEVYVKNGFYKGGNLYLNLNNKAKATTFIVKGNYTGTKGESNSFRYMIVNDTTNIEQLIVPVNDFKEISFSIANNKTEGVDFIYYSLESNTLTYQTNTSVLKTNNEQSSFNIYPVPFNSSATISIDLKESSNVTLEVYDMSGKKISSLLEGNEINGKTTVTLNGDNLSEGIYFCKMTVGNSSFVKKIVKKGN